MTDTQKVGIDGAPTFVGIDELPVAAPDYCDFYVCVGERLFWHGC